MAKLSITELKSVVSLYVASNKIGVDSFTETRDNSVGLLDTLGKIYTLVQTYGDKLDIFDGEDLSFGKTIEEWASDLILPEDFDANGSTTLAPHRSTYRPVSFSFTLGRKYVPITIPNNDIERAVHNEGQFAEIIADKYKVMEDSAKVYRYAMKRQALAVLIARCIYEMDSSNGSQFNAATSYSIGDLVYKGGGDTANHIVFKAYTGGDEASFDAAVAAGYLVKLDLVTALAKPVDTTTGEAFVTQLKKDVEIASDNSQGHSLNGNCLGAVDTLKLILLQGVAPVIDVAVQAGAFHQEKVALPADLVSIPDFGNDSNSAYGLLIDSRGARCHRTYTAVRENINGQGDFLNLFYHVEYTIHVSRNTFVKVYKPV